MQNQLKKSMSILSTTRKRKIYCVLVLFYLLLLVFVANDAWLYHSSIAKLTEVHTKKNGSTKGARGKEEARYRQVMSGILLNGKYRGKRISLSNEYSYSGVVDQKYHKGDQVLIGGDGKGASGSIKSLKRDVHLVALVGALFLLLFILSGKKGVLTICTIAVNIGIFAVGFSRFMEGEDILDICSLMSLLFAVGTLIFLNGFHRKTWAAILSTLCVLAAIMGIFDVVITHTEELDYSTMEYLGNLDNPGDVFRAEVMLAGLGAIMDVAVTISSALGEIIQKKPEVTFLRLFQSGREIGYDIMGTMMNVLLFVFGCGLIPMFLIRMNNEVRFLTIVRLHIPYEICRFLVESIGIVLTIPISIFIASVCMKLIPKGGREK